MNLYWVHTEDHGEDWFVVAKTAKQAAKFHEDEEGYNRGFATANLVMAVPDSMAIEKGWPSDDELEKLGAKVKLCSKKDGNRRAVEIGGAIYIEGSMEESVLNVVGKTKDGVIRVKPLL